MNKKYIRVSLRRLKIEKNKKEEIKINKLLAVPAGHEKGNL